jgi:hypothetical protein
MTRDSTAGGAASRADLAPFGATDVAALLTEAPDRSSW